MGLRFEKKLKVRRWSVLSGALDVDNELKRWCPELRVLRCTRRTSASETLAKGSLENCGEYDVVVTT